MAALLVINPRTSVPPIVKVLDVNVRFEVELPVLKKVELTIEPPGPPTTRAVVLMLTLLPTLTFDVTDTDAVFMLLTYAPAK